MSRGNSHTADKAKEKSGIARLLSQFKSWVAVSEPSGQAFEQHRKEMFKSNGVSRHDPEASMKLQYVISATSGFFSGWLWPLPDTMLALPAANILHSVPATTIPKEAIKPAGPGPDPEELAAARRRNRTRQTCANSSASRSTQSYSTTSSRPGWKPEPGEQSPRAPG